MKSTALHYPSAFSMLTEAETVCIYGGSAIGDAWDLITATVTGLASAAGDVTSSVVQGKMSPLEALCSSFVYLAGNVVASMIWMIM